MTFVTSISVPDSDVKRMRQYGINISKVCRVAIRQALSEREKKSEKESGVPSAKKAPGNTSSEFHPHQEESD
jgi:post-segregation antitoxin (ccd killing protein)